jgi:5'-nucleotidase
MLQVSEGFTYRWNPALPSGKGLVPGSLKLNGTALVDERSYRVIVDSFIAEGGDKFVTFLAGTHRVHTDWQDVQALEAHLSELEKRGKSRGAGATNGRIKTVY